MNSNDKVKNNVVKKATASKGDSLATFVGRMEAQIQRALPNQIQAERFTRAVLTATRTTPQLAQCKRESFAAAMMQSAQLGLIPNTPEGLAYLIPYGNDCQFILGYKGLIQLVWRSGQVKTIQAHAVHENDHFEYSYGLNPNLDHVPSKGDRGEVTHYYAMFETIDGGYGFEVMSVEDIEEHAKKYSSAYRRGRTSPWGDNFDSMALKTVLKQALKYAPLSTDYNRFLSADETVKRADTALLNDENTDYLDMPDFKDFEVEKDEETDEQKAEEGQQSFK